MQNQHSSLVYHTIVRNKLFPSLILLFFILVLFLHHHFAYISHYGYDDIHYAELSNNLLQGHIDFEDHSSYRLSLLIFTSLFYFLLGISDFSTSLPALVVSIGILFIVFQILKKWGTVTLTIGLALTTLSNWFLFYSDKIMPDIYVALSILASIAVIYHYKFINGRKHAFKYALLLSISLLFGFMAKGTIVLVLPLLLYFCVIDILNKRDLKFWRMAAISGLVLLGIYFVVMWSLTGSLLKRFEAIANNSYLNPCSYDQQPLIFLLRRISYEFFYSLVRDSTIIGFVMVISVLFKKRKIPYYKMQDEFSFFMVSAIILLLSSNFTTISVTSYSPMCLDPRHYLFLIPVSAIPASIIISRFIERNEYRYQIIIGLLFISFISLFGASNLSWKLYIPLTGLFIIYAFLRTNTVNQTLFLVLFMAILFIKPLEMIPYAEKIAYKEQKSIFKEYLLNKQEESLVITNEVQVRYANYFNKFGKNNPQEFVQYDDFQYDSTDTRKKFLFLNWYTRYLSALEKKNMPYYARNISPSNKLLYENKDLNIAIYEMCDFSIPELKDEKILLSINNFESPIPFWSQQEGNISSEIQHSEEHSNIVTKYSSTFTYPVDSLLINHPDAVFIKASAYCYFQDKTSAKIIISVQDNEGAYIWKASELQPFIKAFSNWWQVSYELELNSTELKNQSNLRIYILHEDEKPAYVDDFRIEIFGITFR